MSEAKAPTTPAQPTPFLVLERLSFDERQRPMTAGTPELPRRGAALLAAHLAFDRPKVKPLPTVPEVLAFASALRTANPGAWQALRVAGDTVRFVRAMSMGGGAPTKTAGEYQAALEDILDAHMGEEERRERDALKPRARPRPAPPAA